MRSWLLTCWMRWRGRCAKWGARAAVVIAGAWLCLRIAIWITPLPPALMAEPQTSTQYLDRDGKPLRMTLGAEDAYRRSLSIVDCPDVFVQATLAAEDKRFWEHAGVDWLATSRAFKDMLRAGRVVSGASTITQQLIKNAQPRPRNVSAKFKEALQAMKLETRWNKRRILEAYLARIDYGNGCRGAHVAAAFYFDKRLHDLSPAEAALLAALPNAPARLNPRKHLQRAQQRQRLILARMHANGDLREDALCRALAEPVRLNRVGRAFRAPHFVDIVGQQRPQATGTVNTTVRLELNQFAQETLRAQLARLKDRQVSNGAVVVLDVASGDVLALVGSQDYFEVDTGQVNGAWARRSAGSTFKPFTYLMALENGVTAASILPDVPCEMPTATGVFRPHNYNHRCHGPVSLRAALANSLNIPAVHALEAAGGVAALQDRLRRCGLSTLEESASHYGLGLTLGNAETRLLELANAYACLARLGVWRPYRLLASDAAPAVQLFESRAAWLVADILSDGDARAQSFGVDSALAFDFPVACKTGTSTDFRDNWAFAYTPEFVVGVWVGNFDGTPMRDVSGVTGAAPVMHALMERLHRLHGTSWYTQPAGVVTANVNPLTGKRDDAGRAEWFLANAQPPAAAPDDHDAQGRLRLDLAYAQWLASSDNWLGDRAVLREEQDDRPRLVTPLPGMVFYIDPDLPADSQEIPLRLSSNQPVRWTSPTLRCTQRGVHAVVRLAPGTHRLRADIGGQSVETWITVEAL